MKITRAYALPLAALTAAGFLLAACSTPEAPPPEAPKPPPEAPKPPPPPPEAPKPPPPLEAPKPKPAPTAMTITSTGLFEFNRAVVAEAEQAKFDKEVVERLRALASTEFINVNGHADRLGSPQYNQQLSERRAEAVKAYLVSRGVDAARIETYGFGKTLQVKSCPDGKDRKALIDCLAPNRRVVIEVKGMPRQ